MTRQSGVTMGKKSNRKRSALLFELSAFLFVDDFALDRIFGEPTLPPRKLVYIPYREGGVRSKQEQTSYTHPGAKFFVYFRVQISNARQNPALF
jgi:hypothetical protein